MFFIAAKVLAIVEQPLNIVALLLLVSLALSRRRPLLARRSAIVGLVLFFGVGITAAPRAVLRALEDTHAPTEAPLESFAGAVILGGSEDAGVKADERGQVLLNAAAERLTTATGLLRRYPHYAIVHTGFSGRLDSGGMTESAMARLFFAEQGVDLARVTFEDRARDTYENALRSRELVAAAATERWLLVTSAAHMPRSIAVFRSLGWNIEPWPVDYRTGRTLRFADYSIFEGAGEWQVALHELLGFVAYWATGRL